MPGGGDDRERSIHDLLSCTATRRLLQTLVMIRRHHNTVRSIVAVSSLMALSLMTGCSTSQNDSQNTPPANAASTTASDDTTSASSQSGPSSVLQQYFHALGAGQFDQAYALWRTQSHQAPASPADLKSQYNDVASIQMTVTGDTRTEGAAGTVYATVPITVTEHTRDGTDKSRTGKCVLARSNNVPASAAKAQHWQLHSCDLS